MLPPRYRSRARPNGRPLAACFVVALAALGCGRDAPPVPPERALTELRFVEKGVVEHPDPRLERGVFKSLGELSHPVLTGAKTFRPALSCRPGVSGKRSQTCHVSVPGNLPGAAATIFAWVPPENRQAHRNIIDDAPPGADGPAAAPTPATERALPSSSVVAARLVPPEPRPFDLGSFDGLSAFFSTLQQVPQLAERTVETEPFSVPPNGVLRLSFGIEETAWSIDSAPVYFRIVVEEEGGAVQDLFRRILDPARREQDRRWFDADVDLTDLAGRRVRLRFLTEPAEPGDQRPSLPLWGDPRVIAPAAPRRPSIVLISLDTLRAKSMSAYGHPVETTPTITTYARRGALFENAFTTFSNTLPSHMSMLTGLLPAEHGVVQLNDVLADRHATLAEMLRRAGYATGAFTEDALLDARHGFNRGFSTYYEHTSIATGTGDARGTFGRALEWAGHHADEQFFLFIHTYEVHAPYDPPEEYRTLFHDGAGSELGAPRRAYEQEIRRLDDELRRLLDGLETLLPERDLLVVITADHGEEFYEHGAAFHVQLFDEVMHVPLVMVFPGVIPPDLRVTAVVSLVDVVPTIAALAGVPLDNDVDGTSLVPLLSADPPPRWRDVVFGEYLPVFGAREPRFVARSERVKCIVAASGRHDVCFDLVADPDERQPHAWQETPEFSRIHAILEQYRAHAVAAREAPRAEPVAQPEPTPAADHRVERKLRALGYIE